MANILMQFALNKIASNPDIANNPRNKELISIIQNGDSVKGKQVANNLCESYGLDKDAALKQAAAFFGIKI